EPERNRREGQRHELARVGANPGVSPRAVDDGVREEDEAGPADGCVPRPEGLDLREGRGLGEDHGPGPQPDQRCTHHVTRVPKEQPRSAGVPTAFPKIITLCVDPKPPGTSSVFSARARSASAAPFQALTRPSTK